MRRTEAWLDQGLGSCRLRESTSADWVAEAMHHFDANRYELGCYVVMPNHVHAIVRPFDCGTDTLQRVLKSWKGYTATRINEKFGLTCAFWQEESFDRIIRDEEHLYRVIQYIGANPAKAGLNPGVARLWIRSEWKALGWGFEEA